ncbi:carbohydrate ABC transporter permease [Leifsonia sp. SIMBA_070]|uniref:carbohydrate ABC transporter permease n=1 Tax=Leifsonia sp. SIMBA_070 TaxID=3085810 RepID=UPI00397CE8C9
MALVLVAHPSAPVRTVAPPVEARTGEASAARRRGRSVTVVGHIVLAVVAVASIFPIYWMFATAFRQPADAAAQTLVPWPLSVDSYVTVWQQIPILAMIGNTFLMAFSVAVCQLIIAILAAYGFAMWQFPGKNILFLLFIGSWLVPFQVTMIPNYVLISQLGLLGTIGGVIVPNLCSAFAVMLMRQHMQSFPRELIDAAHMDGRSHWGILIRVVLPNMRPALAALGIMLFIEAWNNYLWPSLIFQHQSDALIQVGIRSFLGAEGDNWGAIMAAAGLACLPIFLIYLFLQRYIVDAFVRSGLR